MKGHYGLKLYQSPVVVKIRVALKLEGGVLSLLGFVLAPHWTVRCSRSSSLVGSDPGAFPLGGVTGKRFWPLTREAEFPPPQKVPKIQKTRKSHKNKGGARSGCFSALQEKHFLQLTREAGFLYPKIPQKDP